MEDARVIISMLLVGPRSNDSAESLKQRVVARRCETQTRSTQLSPGLGSRRAVCAFYLNKDQFWEAWGKLKKVEIKK